MSVNVLLFKITLILYFVATVLFLLDAVARKEKAGQTGRYVLWTGFGLHCITLVSRYMFTGYAPATNLYESLIFFAWSIVGIFIAFDLKYKLKALAAFCSPLALFLMLIGSATPKAATEVNPMLDSWWFPVHVSLAFLGDAVFAMAAASGAVYLIQERMLKNKKFSSIYFRLPSLDVLDAINYKCLSFGFPLMTMGIISGAIWANSAWGGYWRWDPKETWALLTWFFYAALLHGRLTVGWRGRRAAIFAIIGFLCLLFSYLGVNWLLSAEHSFRAMGGQ